MPHNLNNIKTDNFEAIFLSEPQYSPSQGLQPINTLQQPEMNKSFEIKDQSNNEIITVSKSGVWINYNVSGIPTLYLNNEWQELTNLIIVCQAILSKL